MVLGLEANVGDGFVLVGVHKVGLEQEFSEVGVDQDPGVGGEEEEVPHVVDPHLLDLLVGDEFELECSEEFGRVEVVNEDQVVRVHAQEGIDPLVDHNLVDLVVVPAEILGVDDGGEVRGEFGDAELVAERGDEGEVLGDYMSYRVDLLAEKLCLPSPVDGESPRGQFRVHMAQVIDDTVTIIPELPLTRLSWLLQLVLLPALLIEHKGINKGDALLGDHSPSRRAGEELHSIFEVGRGGVAPIQSHPLPAVLLDVGFREESLGDLSELADCELGHFDIILVLELGEDVLVLIVIRSLHLVHERVEEVVIL